MTNETIEIQPLPFEPAAEGPLGREIIMVDTVRSGQPRAYADHERVVHVTMIEYNQLGMLHTADAYIARELADSDATPEEQAEFAESVRADHGARLIMQALRHLHPHSKVSRALADELAENRWCIGLGGYEVRDPASGDISAWIESYVDYAKVVGPNTVEIRHVSPYLD